MPSSNNQYNNEAAQVAVQPEASPAVRTAGIAWARNRQTNGGPLLTNWRGEGRHVLLIVAVGFIANFLFSNSFGFYEDDWYFFAKPYGFPTREWFNQMWWAMLHFRLGRPLQWFYMHAFGYLGARYDSIEVLYVLAAIFFCTSAVLLYCLLRVRFPPFFALLVSLLFVLSPLTTLRQFLNGMLAFGPGFICLFIAFILYGRRRYLLSYFFAILALFTYETLYLPFVAAPFFRRGRTRFREICVHFSVYGAVLVGYLVARIKTSEDRVVDAVAASSFGTALHVVQFDLFYALSSFKSYIYAAYVSFHEPTWPGAIWTVCLLVPALLYLARGESRLTSRLPKRKLTRARRLWWMRNAVFPGILLITASYLLSYWHLYYALYYPLTGRDTRVSTAATVGSSVIIASVICLGFTFRQRWWRWFLYTIMTAALAAALMFSFVVQNDYVRQWQMQRSFVTQLVMLTPDVTSDDLFVVRRSWVSETLFPRKERPPAINTQLHGLSESTSVLFSAPKVFFVYSDDWRRYISVHEDGELFWTQSTFPGGWQRDPTTSFGRGVITLVDEGQDRLRRINAPVYVSGRQINLIQDSGENAARERSNWGRFQQSPLVRRVLQPYAFTLIAKNVEEGPPPYLTVKAEVRFGRPESQPTGGLVWEPLVVTGVSGAGDLVSVREPDSHHAAFRIDHWGLPGVESGLVDMDPNAIQTIQVAYSEGGIVVSMNGENVTSLHVKPYPTVQAQITVGKNEIGGGITGRAFSGQVLSNTLLRPRPRSIIAARVRFGGPGAHKPRGDWEPLVVTGVPGAGDLISVHFVSSTRVMFRIDHWGYPGVVSAAMDIDPNKIYSIEAHRGDDGEALTVEGEEVLRLGYAPYHASVAQVAIGKNKIGGGITSPMFSGEVLSTHIEM